MNIEVLTNEELASLRKYAQTVNDGLAGDIKDLRNATMIFLMLDAGLRIGEVAKLTKNCLMFGSEVSNTIGVPATIAKNKIARQIPTGERIRILVGRMWLRVWSIDATIREDYCFYTNHYEEHITTRQIRRIVKKVSKTWIGREIHPHILRHTFATRLMRVTKPSVVQELLGHKSLSSTQVYMHPDSNDLTEAIEAIT